MTVQTFPATYAGACARGCDRGIRPGDPIQPVSAMIHSPRAAYQHAGPDCPEDPDPLQVERPPCPDCFQVPAANGACGCDS